jgi:hypothetical protein
MNPTPLKRGQSFSAFITAAISAELPSISIPLIVKATGADTFSAATSSRLRRLRAAMPLTTP